MNTKTKTDTITPAIAATQAAWHAKQSAEYYAQSLLKLKSPQARATARRRFMADARLALPVMGVDEFLRHFQAWLDADSERFEEAKATVMALAAELALAPRPVAVAPAPVADALAKAKDALARALAQVGEALRAVEGHAASAAA